MAGLGLRSSASRTEDFAGNRSTASLALSRRASHCVLAFHALQPDKHFLLSRSYAASIVMSHAYVGSVWSAVGADVGGFEKRLIWRNSDWLGLIRVAKNSELAAPVDLLTAEWAAVDVESSTWNKSYLTSCV